MGSFVGGGNQYIQLVSRHCTVNCRPSVRNYQLSHIRSGVRTADLRGGNLADEQTNCNDHITSWIEVTRVVCTLYCSLKSHI